MKVELAKIETKAGQVVTRLLTTDDPALINPYESEIKRLDEHKVLMTKNGQFAA